MSLESGAVSELPIGADKDYEGPYFSEGQLLAAEQRELLKSAREILADNEKLADALADYENGGDQSAKQVACAAIAFMRGSVDDKRTARRTVFAAAAIHALFMGGFSHVDGEDAHTVAIKLEKEFDHAH